MGDPQILNLQLFTALEKIAEYENIIQNLSKENTDLKKGVKQGSKTENISHGIDREDLQSKLKDTLKKNTENEKKIQELSDENQNWATAYFCQVQMNDDLTEKLTRVNNKKHVMETRTPEEIW